MHKDLPTRKHPRLKGYDYSSNGAYFITLCVEGMRKMLGELIVGRDDLGAPYITLTNHGLIAQKYIEQIEMHYKGIFVDKYVIMPNHIHVIIWIERDNITSIYNSAPRSSRPTTAMIPRVLTAFKKFANKEFGFNMWQESYHNHIYSQRGRLFNTLAVHRQQPREMGGG